MRGVVDALLSAAPLGEQLPAVMQEDEFAQRLVSAFDVALAPIMATLDNLDAYVGALLAPEDFVSWLATWVGVEFGTAARDAAARRDLVARAVSSYRRDGTPAGIRATVALATGAEVLVTDSGGAAWSATPGAAVPGDDGAWLHVRVVTDDPAVVDERWLAALVTTVSPADVTPTVEVVAR